MTPKLYKTDFSMKSYSDFSHCIKKSARFVTTARFVTDCGYPVIGIIRATGIIRPQGLKKRTVSKSVPSI